MDTSGNTPFSDHITPFEVIGIPSRLLYPIQCAERRLSIKCCVLSGNYSINVAGISRKSYITRRLVRGFSVKSSSTSKKHLEEAPNTTSFSHELVYRLAKHRDKPRIACFRTAVVWTDITLWCPDITCVISHDTFNVEGCVYNTSKRGK